MRNTARTALLIIFQQLSLIAIGCTPGFLLKAISQQEGRAWRPVGSMYKQQRCLAIAAIEEHRSDEDDAKEEQICHHAETSRPVGPAEPKVLRATDLMRAPFITSYTTKCGE